jgi:signal transduction histidine kinase
MSLTLSMPSEPGVEQLNLNLESTLQGLTLYEACIEYNHTAAEVLRLFEEEPLLPGLILMDKNQLVGMISRRRFFEYLSRRYSLELLSKRSLRSLYQLNHTEILVFPSYTSITAAVRESLRRSPELIYEPIIVQTAPGIYKLLDVHQLLLAQSEVHEITMAAYKQMGLALQQAKNQLLAVLDAVPGFVSWISSDLQYLGVNQHLAASFNLSSEEFVGQELSCFDSSPHFSEFVEQFFASPTKTTSQEVTAEVDGNLKNYLMVAQKYNQDQAAVTVGIDITERKRLEEELRASLEREKELGDLKSRFISMTSHEFRTPLSTILSSAELLEHYSKNWSEEKKLIHLHRIQIAVQHMIGLLDDVLIIGKAEAGQSDFKPEPLHLEEFCLELVKELQLNEGDSRAINLIARCKSLSFCLDEKLLRHILSNLLSNAIKYSPEGSPIRFEIAQQKDAIVFQIEDKGIGIPLQDRQCLFESFHRAANVGNIPGTGLGLAIVKKCVDLHGGEITVKSKVGVGTKFKVRLPLKSAVGARSPRPC